MSRKSIFKIISFVLIIILIPFLINLIAGYTTWFGTKDKTEVSIALEGHITVGSIMESSIPELALTWNDEPINNLLKLSWHVENTGTKGIASFEYGPSITYPENIQLASSTISTTSQNLKVNNLIIEPNERRIDIEDLGIFNPGDFFNVDVYLTDIPESEISLSFFEGWNLEAKALDLDIRKNLEAATRIAEKTEKPNWLQRNRFWIVTIYALFACLGSIWYMRRKMIYFVRRKKTNQ